MFQFLLEVISRIFVDVENNEHLRVLLDDLTAEFRTDGTTAAGDKDNLVLDVGSNFVHVVLDLVTAKKVFDLDFSKFGYGDFTVHQLIDGRKDLDLGLCFLADVDDVSSVFGGCAGDGNEDLIDAILLDECRDVFPATFDLDAVDDASLFVGVVVDEGQHIAPELFRTLDFVQNGRTSHTGTNDEDLRELASVLIIRKVCFPGTEDAVRIAVDDDTNHQNQIRDEIIATGNAPSKNMETTDLENGGEGDTGKDGEHFPEAGDGPHVFVQTVQCKADDRNDDVDRQEPERMLPVLLRDTGDGKVKTQPKPHKRSDDTRYDVHEDEQQRAYGLAMRHDPLDERRRFEVGRIHSCVSPEVKKVSSARTLWMHNIAT